MFDNVRRKVGDAVTGVVATLRNSASESPEKTQSYSRSGFETEGVPMEHWTRILEEHPDIVVKLPGHEHDPVSSWTFRADDLLSCADQVQWDRYLNADEVAVLIHHEVEKGESSIYSQSFFPESGYFACRGCGLPLYAAVNKFEATTSSVTGLTGKACAGIVPWPTFGCHIGENVLLESPASLSKTDDPDRLSRFSLGHLRMSCTTTDSYKESSQLGLYTPNDAALQCARCSLHLGYVFPMTNGPREADGPREGDGKQKHRDNTGQSKMFTARKYHERQTVNGVALWFVNRPLPTRFCTVTTQATIHPKPAQRSNRH